MIGNTPKAHTKMVTKSVLGWKGIMSALRTFNTDIPPTSRAFQKMVEIHTGRIDDGRISWRRRRRRAARASGSYVWVAGGTDGAARADRVDVMAREGEERCGGGVLGIPVDMASCIATLR
jgi:hypothetical protein